MAKKKIKVVMAVTYSGKEGQVPAGKAVPLPEAEARDLIDQGLAQEYAAEADAPSLINPEMEALRTQVAELHQQLAAKGEELQIAQADFDAKLEQAQEYAEGLEAQLQQAGQGGEEPEAKDTKKAGK
ncbi:hypothetical protein [Desulfovibrio ferrophilus]|uniref:Putative kinesin K39 n=1 Tax=Desulfovibrio ferrophilus TaxID=241368 RepID=A0A2Z6AYY5_9BACT|nr:hypothetical protein [Desulfovibrio ferrophilus]BBD08459.1 putative kinesin K39 [Desulfovibrio ferrophilus]